MNNGLGPWSQVGKLQNFKKVGKTCVKNHFVYMFFLIISRKAMQNDLKYGKIREICDINGYFAGKKLKKIAPAAPKNFPLRARKLTQFFKGEGGKEFNF